MQLAEVLARRAYNRPIVLGIPRGGVPVAGIAANIGADREYIDGELRT